jgi:hypothetical protein
MVSNTCGVAGIVFANVYGKSLPTSAEVCQISILDIYC